MMQHATSIDDFIVKRSKIVGHCIEWLGYFEGDTPMIERTKDGVRTRTPVRRYLLGLKNRNQVAINTCGNPKCIRPSHCGAVASARKW